MAPNLYGFRRRHAFIWPALALTAMAAGSAGCHREPLLAPSGSVITLTAPATASSIDTFPIVALITEGGTTTTPPASGTNGQTGQTNNNSSTTTTGGNPVHNGTVVNFTATMGSITPTDVTTVNGKVTVNFTGDGRAGTVTVTAISGSALKTITITLAAPSGS